MRALFYVGDKRWSGSARAFLMAARGLSARGHQITLACSEGTRLARLASEARLETVPIASSWSAPTTWELRKVLQERFIEVVFVVGEADQLLVSSAMRLAERGAVVRRVPAFERVALERTGRLAVKLAATGLLFTAERDMHDGESPEWAIPPAVAPLGVDASTYDAVRPVSRADITSPAHGLLIACIYEPSGRQRIATVFRTLSLLAPRHPDLHVVVLGPRSFEEDLRIHAAALGVNPVVSFVGDRPDHFAVLRAANVGWVVAGDDGGAYGCLDLMALRLPVIMERSPLSQHYVAAGISGILLSPGDAAETASAVAAFLGHEDKVIAMGNAGRTRVQRDFPESAMIDAFERAAMAAADRSTWATR